MKGGPFRVAPTPHCANHDSSQQVYQRRISIRSPWIHTLLEGKGKEGSRPVCALPKARQYAPATAANRVLLPEHRPKAKAPSRCVATTKGRSAKAGPILSSHRYCPDLDTEDAEVLGRRG